MMSNLCKQKEGTNIVKESTLDYGTSHVRNVCASLVVPPEVHLNFPTDACVDPNLTPRAYHLAHTFPTVALDP